MTSASLPSNTKKKPGIDSQAPSDRPRKNGGLPRQLKNPDRIFMPNALRDLDWFTSLHPTFFERPAYYEFCSQAFRAEKYKLFATEIPDFNVKPESGK